MIIDIALIVGLIIDLFLTYLFLGLYQKKFPKKDYTVIERNPLIRYAIRHKGLGEGILASGAAIMFILFVLIRVLPIEWKYFLAGVYYMMITFHLTNFLAIKNLKGGKTHGNKKSKG